MQHLSFAITTTNAQLSALAPDEDAHVELLLGFAQTGPRTYRVLGHDLLFDHSNCLSGHSPAMRSLPAFARKAIGSSAARSAMSPTTLCEFLYMTLSCAAHRLRQLRELEEALAAQGDKPAWAVQVLDDGAACARLSRRNGTGALQPCATLTYHLTSRLPVTVTCADADLRARLLSRPLPAALLSP